MDKQLATTIFESLASGVRLDVYRLLVKNAPDGLVAGEIAAQLALPPTNLSFHLKAMTHSGLINVTSEGRYQRYRANLTLMQDLIGYLTAECCTGHPEQCFETDAAAGCCDAQPLSSSTPTDSTL
jgi:DNA-binding transcriptional ArsR family regulator